MHEPLVMSLRTPTRILLTISGDLSRERLDSLSTTVAAAQEYIKETSRARGEKLRIMLDLSKFSGIYDVEALELMTAFAKANAPYIEKTVIFGGNLQGEMAGQVVETLAGRENIEFYRSEAEAKAVFEA